MMNLEQLKSYVGNNCFTSCIRKSLLIQGYDVEEEKLICGNSMLRLCCDTKYDALFSPMFDIVSQSCERHGIRLIEVKKNINEVSLKRNIDEYGNVIVNVDCRYLTYASKLMNTVSKQHFHYINILKYEDNRFLVSDSYIPTTPVETYLGWMTFDELIYDTCKAYAVKVKDLLPWKESDIEQSIISSLEDYVYNNITRDTFDRFIKNIENLKNMDDEKRIKNVLLEMATTIGIAGVSSSRKFIKKLIKRCGNFRDKYDYIDNAIEDIIKDYTILRVLLLKSMYSLNNEDLCSVEEKINSIKSNEYNIFNKLLKSIKRKKG